MLRNINRLSLYSALCILYDFLSLAEPHNEGKRSSKFLFSDTEDTLEGGGGDAELTTDIPIAFFTVV